MSVISRIVFCITCILILSTGIFAQETSYTNLIGMKFVLVQPGSMVVGKFQPTIGKPPNPDASANEIARYKLAEKMAGQDAMPGFKVNISYPYYMGSFEVTQEQWAKVMRRNPSVFQSSDTSDDFRNHPVDNVTWRSAQDFIRKLNLLDKDHVYRLPSEFEWEYAARAGATDDIPWAGIRASAVLSGKTHQKVGTMQPNAWGLYDMLGNVWEWVSDFYNEKIFADPIPPSTGDQHVLKGASFTSDVKNATYMTHAAGPGNGFDIGFRVIMEVNEKSPR